MQTRPSITLDRSVVLLASAVYFVQGALSITGIAFPLYLRTKGWGIPEISTFAFVTGLPWTLKILYGALSDGFPLGGRRRRPYLIIASLLSLGAWLALACVPHHAGLLYALGITASFGFAITDVVTDAVIVEKTTVETTRLYQSLAWGFRSLGAILGGIGGGWLAQHYPYRLIFGVTAALPLSTLLISSIIQDPPTFRAARIRNLVYPITGSLRHLFTGDLKWFSLLLLAGTFSASFSTPFFFFLKERLGFSETFLGTLSSLSWLGAILGCFLYGKIFAGVSVKKTLCWAVGLNSLNVLSAYFIQTQGSAVGLSLLGGVLAYLTLLPLMGTAALLARQKGIEGALFALLMSVHNLGQILSVFIGGRLFDIIGLGPLIVLSAGIGLTGYFFIGRIKTLE